MDNKEATIILINYLLKQDPKDVARALSACMIDFNRIIHAESLSEDEMNNLFFRIKMNVEELHKFLKNPDDEKFSVIQKENWNDG